MIKAALWLPEDDWKWLKARSGPSGASRALRDILVAHRRQIEEQEAPRRVATLNLEGL